MREQCFQIWARLIISERRKSPVVTYLYSNTKHRLGGRRRPGPSRKDDPNPEVRLRWLVQYFQSLARTQGFTHADKWGHWAEFMTNAIAAVLLPFEPKLRSLCDDASRKMTDKPVKWNMYTNERTGKPKVLRYADILLPLSLQPETETIVQPTSRRVATRKESLRRTLPCTRSSIAENKTTLLCKFASTVHPEEGCLQGVAECLNDLFDYLNRGLTASHLDSAKRFCLDRGCNTRFWWKSESITSWAKSLGPPTDPRPLWAVLSSRIQPTDQVIRKAVRSSLGRDDNDDEANIREEQEVFGGDNSESLCGNERNLKLASNRMTEAGCLSSAETSTSPGRGVSSEVRPPSSQSTTLDVQQACLQWSSLSIQRAQFQFYEAETRMRRAEGDLQSAANELKAAKEADGQLKLALG
jgi:hypothetical protein